jgi:hypothetical protein
MYLLQHFRHFAQSAVVFPCARGIRAWGITQSSAGRCSFLIWAGIHMVMVISFLTLTNIALGYGLAVYVNQNFGTLLFALPKRRKVKPGATVDSSEAIAAVATPPSQPATKLESTNEQSMSVAASDTPASEIAASEPVDEENVLAGIEEFRSQLAKISESGEPLAAEPERELVGAAN